MASEADKQRRIELLTEEVQELDAANLTVGEEETLNERKKVIVHAQSILDGITAAHAALSGDEEGIPLVPRIFWAAPPQVCRNRRGWMKVLLLCRNV